MSERKICFKDVHGDLVLKENREVPFLIYPKLEETGIVRHGFSTRFGGVSKEHLASMNLSYSRGDEEDAVTENFRRMAEALGIPAEDLVFSAQTHTTNVRRAVKEDRGRGIRRTVGYTDVDGLITNEPGVCLTTFYADCVPLYFVDPVNKAVGLSHSGWRGTVGRMGRVTIEAMTKAFETAPSDLITAIGPSICADCYEVSEDVAVQFMKEFGADAVNKIVFPKGNGKYHLDLWEANRLVFLEAGVREENILMPGLCTCCNPEALFSHRASHGRRGNLAAFLELK